MRIEDRCPLSSLSRRDFLAGVSAAGAGLTYNGLLRANEKLSDPAADDAKALIAITFDLEMSAGYPVKGKPRDTYPWDYQKGNLNDETKQYTVEACRQVKAKGGLLHCFLVGQVLEHRSVDWLKEIINAGHPIGNHTYDHVRITAQESEDVQYRFRRSPWLVAGMTPAEAIRENIRLCEVAMQQRLGITPVGFRAPYGFRQGIADRPDVQEIILSLGYTWASCKHDGPDNVKPTNPDEDDFDAIVATHRQHQPFLYPSGLIEVPPSPTTDVGVFRSRSWKLEHFLRLIEKSVQSAIENRTVYDFTVHPSIMYVEDPEFMAVNLICDLVNASGSRAEIVGLNAFARRAKLQNNIER